MAIIGRLNAFEASVAAPRADATALTVDTVSITVDAFNIGDVASFVGIIATANIVGVLAATEAADTATFAGQTPALPIYGGRPWVPPLEPIEGYGFGILPRVAGEAHGVIVAAGVGAAMLRNPDGEATGAVGARGRSEGQLRVQAAASGARGTKGAAVASLELGAAGSGAISARGSAGAAMIGNLDAVAVGRHDDDEAVIAWLLAA